MPPRLKFRPSTRNGPLFLRKRGYATEVIAPSRVPRRPADRIKTDRRDALLLARLHRSGDLTPIVVQDPKDEAIRDLVRTREDAMHDRQRARLRLRSFLLRQGHSYTGRRWGPAHQLFLSKTKFQDPAHHIAFTEYRLAVHVCTECVERLEAALRAEAQSWRSLPMNKALMTLRGIDFLSATTIVARLGDLRRFPHPRELMGYLGLVPSEHSSGPTQHRGELTRTGNTYVRRILIEAAWNYRFPARVGESLRSRGKSNCVCAAGFVVCDTVAFTTTKSPPPSPANYAGLSGILDGKFQ
jgi:transposase